MRRTFREYQQIIYTAAKAGYEELMKAYPFDVEDLDGEVWCNFDDNYQISTFGRVKSFLSGTPIIRRPALTSGGYLFLPLMIKGVRKNFYIHRLVAEVFIPNTDNKPQVNHRDGCKFNNHVSNLEWATRSENMRHSYQTELRGCGDKNVLAKLQASDVIYVRDNPDNLTQEDLAKQFSVAPQTISDVQRGKTYKQVGGKIRKQKAGGTINRATDDPLR